MADFITEVKAVAKGLIASGLETGDAVAILSRTRYEWALADWAIWWVGGVSVPIYETSSPSQIQWIASDSRSEEHTSELQSRGHLVCRLLLEKKKSETHVTAALVQS